MKETTTWVACVAIVSLASTVTMIHYNQITHNAQRECMDAHGSWETRENSNEIGCRFPPTKGSKGATP